MHRELSKHGKQFERENRILRDCEIVNKAGDEDHRPDTDSGRDKGNRVGAASEICNADEKYGEASGEQEKPDEVKFFEFLPSRLLVVMLRVGWRIVESEGSSDTHDGVDDANVIRPSPAGVDEKQRRNVYAQAAPGDVDTKLCPSEPNAAAPC